MAALSPAGAAHAFEAELRPAEVRQGDVFALTVTGTQEQPDAVFMGSWLIFAPCGQDCYIAFGAIGVDTGPGEYLLDIATDADRKRLRLNVKKVDFPVSNITLQPDKVTLNAKDEKRADNEAAMLRAIWAKPTERLWDGEFKIPIKGGFSTVFGVRRLMNGVKKSIHSGIDIRGSSGSPVQASNRGRVVVAADMFFGGLTVVLDHGQGLYTVYMHLSKFRAAVGDVVARGDVIAEVGSTGRSTGPHLHFTLKVGANSANPLSLLKIKL